MLKMKVILIMTISLLITGFTETFKRMSQGSKYDKMNEFYTLLTEFIETHEASAIETKIVK